MCDGVYFSRRLCISIASVARAAASAAADPRDLLTSGWAQLQEDDAIVGCAIVNLGVYKTDGVLSVAR